MLLGTSGSGLTGIVSSSVGSTVAATMATTVGSSEVATSVVASGVATSVASIKDLYGKNATSCGGVWTVRRLLCLCGLNAHCLGLSGCVSRGMH